MTNGWSLPAEKKILNGVSSNNMLTHADLKKGTRIILDKEPYEVLEAQLIKKARGRSVLQGKIKNLITGNVFDRNFHQGDAFAEAELLKLKAKFLYSHRDCYFFSEEKNSAKRFDLSSEQIGSQAKFLKPNLIVEALIFNEKVVSISLPIKIQLKVTEAPPGLKGDRSQAGNKIVTLETKAEILVPLFIKEGDIIEINTETEEYARRIE